MANFEVRADIGKNRVNIKLDGFFSDAEAAALSNQAVEEGKKLRAPFDVVSDLTNFKPASPQGFENFKRGAAELVKMGARKVVRIDSTSGAGSLQFSRLSKTTGYEVLYAKSMEEAEKLLDSLK